jgi:hypothetical protein
MAEPRGITFNDWSMRGIIAGRKTMTRRPIKPQPASDQGQWIKRTSEDDRWWIMRSLEFGPEEHYVCDVRCPHGGVGDRSYCREAHAIESSKLVGDYPPPYSDGRPLHWVDEPDWGRYWEQAHYRASDPTPDLAYEDSDDATCRWRPAMFMPKWAARQWLRVTGLKVERVQDISYQDVLAEGVTEAEIMAHMPAIPHAGMDIEAFKLVAARLAFKDVWDSIYDAKSPYRWELNPWCWRVGFRVVEAK